MKKILEKLNNMPAVKELSLAGQVYLVGGCVRDFLINRSSKDIDIIVLGLPVEKMVAILEQHGRVDEVGKSFGVIKWESGELGTIDVALPRTEKRVGPGHRDFKIVSDHTLSLKDDMIRRDFTVNAIAMSLSGEIIDYFDGAEHAAQKKLKAVSDMSFIEDSLRILRGIQFSSRFGFDIDQDTFKMMKQNANELKHVSMERVGQEIEKFMSGPHPEKGIELLDQLGLLSVYFPEVEALKSSGDGHKDNYVHTLGVMKNTSVFKSPLLNWVALLHDIGKATTKKFIEGHGWTFHYHEEASAKMIAGIFNRLKMPIDYAKKVEHLVRLHGRPKSLVENGVTDSAVRRLVVETGDALSDLMSFCFCDMTTKNLAKIERMRADLDSLYKRIEEVTERDSLKDFRIAFSGDDIMQKFAIKPSKLVGDIKAALYELVMDGLTNDFEILSKKSEEIFLDLTKK